MNKKQVAKYLIIVFILAYAIEILASVYAVKNPDVIGKTVFQISAMVLMFTPFFGTLITKGSFKGIGFKPKFKGCAYLLPLCFFGPAIIASLGAALFYIIFPDMFDLTGSYLQSTLPEGMNFLEELEKRGVSYSMYIVIVIFQCITYAPIFNMFLALGEEVGWRGFLYPELEKSFGKIGSWIIGGIIWGAFHFPMMIIAGYEYGTDYPGFPFVGIIVFTVFCISLGIIHEIVYDKSKCIWYPALLHGAVNACTFTLMFYNVNNPERASKLMILGPAFNAAIGGIPALVVAVVLAMVTLSKKKKNAEVQNGN